MMGKSALIKSLAQLASCEFLLWGNVAPLAASRQPSPSLTIYDLARRQYAFHRLVAPSFKDVDFEADVMARWWPMGHRRLVVLDPQRSFGAPIAAESGIPTATLADVAQGEGSPQAVTPMVSRHRAGSARRRRV
jgi:hypothetical protein